MTEYAAIPVHYDDSEKKSAQTVSSMSCVKHNFVRHRQFLPALLLYVIYNICRFSDRAQFQNPAVHSSGCVSHRVSGAAHRAKVPLSLS